MNQKPHKKDELTLANNVLKLAETLLKVVFVEPYMGALLIASWKQIDTLFRVKHILKEGELCDILTVHIVCFVCL